MLKGGKNQTVQVADTPKNYSKYFISSKFVKYLMLALYLKLSAFILHLIKKIKGVKRDFCDLKFIRIIPILLMTLPK